MNFPFLWGVTWIASTKQVGNARKNVKYARVRRIYGRVTRIYARVGDVDCPNVQLRAENRGIGAPLCKLRSNIRHLRARTP